MSKTMDEKLDMIFDAVEGLTQKVTSIDQRLSKVELDIETLKDSQKVIIEGQQTATAQLERKIDEAYNIVQGFKKAFSK